MTSLRIACFLLLTATGCVESITPVVQKHEKSTELTYADCGNATPEETACTDTAVDDCLLAAFESCTPSRAEVDFFHGEEKWQGVIFIEPSATGYPATCSRRCA